MSGQTLIALIKAVASLVVSVVTAAVSSGFRRRSETELAKLENQLAEQSERAARRAYVYDARKRLSTEFQPVLFQMTESLAAPWVRRRSAIRFRNGLQFRELIRTYRTGSGSHSGSQMGLVPAKTKIV